jgi:hypothetical protein
MVDRVKDASGVLQPKIDIAQRAAIKLVDQFEQYAREHPERPIILGIYEFSDRDGEASTRAVIPPGPPDASRAQNAIKQMRGGACTPIGNAMIRAKLDIDSTGLSKGTSWLLPTREHERLLAGGRDAGHHEPE